MTFDFASEYIPRRMKELGYGDGYHLRLKHLNMAAGEKRILEAYNQLIILVKVGINTKVESDMGVMDEADFYLPENRCEHQGLITMTNMIN